MENFETILTQAQKSLRNVRGIFDREDIQNKLKELEQLASKKDFWKDQNLVKKTTKKKNFLKIF